MTEDGLRERKKQATRQLLAQSALELVSTHGLDHVTVEDIAARADVSPRTFFNYFASKEDALTAPYNEDHALVPRSIAELPKGLGPYEAMHQSLRAQLPVIEAESAVWISRFKVLRENPQLFGSLITRGHEDERLAAVALGEYLGLAEDDRMPGFVVNVAMAALRWSAAQWATEPGRHQLEDLIDTAFAMLVDPVSQPAPATSPSPAIPTVSNTKKESK